MALRLGQEMALEDSLLGYAASCGASDEHMDFMDGLMHQWIQNRTGSESCVRMWAWLAPPSGSHHHAFLFYSMAKSRRLKNNG